MALVLRTLNVRFDHGHEVDTHDHDWGQLVYAASGAVQVWAAGRVWLVPPARALWVAPGTRHRLRTRGQTRLRSLYVPPRRCTGLPEETFGLEVSPLFRELIVELTRRAFVDDDDPFDRILDAAVLAALRRAERLPLVLTMPTDRRARRVAEAILADVERDRRTDRLVGDSGGSLRTIQRRFLDETGLTLSEWRQQARLMAGASALLDGGSVADAAWAAGYGSASAFIHAFRGRFGQTPAQFGRGLSSGVQ